MKFRFTYIIALGTMIVSCKKELQPQESSASTDTVSAATAEAPEMTQPEATPVTQSFPNQAAQSIQAQPASSTTAPGMNPPHGQPGHRCDIAVGAPLSSAPGNAAAPTMTQAPSQPVASTPPLVSAPAAKTAPGMNPPHGEPGHICSIPVGQPLPKE